MAIHHPPIQIVDKDDKPIGGAGMFEAYDQGLIHRIVFVAVLDEQGNVLLQKRSAKMANFPNCWDISAGGHVDEGESYLEAAHRELQEELGLKDLKLREVRSFYHEIEVHDRLLKRFNKVYTTKIPRDTPIDYAAYEITQVRWFSRAEIVRLIKEHPDQIANGLTDSIAVL